jgi:hypothetical protein
LKYGGNTAGMIAIAPPKSHENITIIWLSLLPNLLIFLMLWTIVQYRSVVIAAIMNNET